MIIPFHIITNLYKFNIIGLLLNNVYIKEIFNNLYN